MTAPLLRILMTTDMVGGVFVYAATLARALAARNCLVDLVIMGPQPDPGRISELARTPGIRTEPTDLALEWMDPEGRDAARAAECLAATAARLRPDVVHLNGFREALVPWPAPALVGAHSCVLWWWQACHGTWTDERRWRDYAGAVAAGLEAADAWAAPTAAFRDRIAALYAPPRPGEVIRHGIATAAAVHAKQPVILAAGRLWDEAKNMRQLVAAARHLAWPVRIAGPSSLAPAASSRGHDGNVEMLGDLSSHDLASEMEEAAIVVAPSLYEPFGLTVLEAAAAGCALVLADIPTFRELWEGAALFVDPRNEAALALVLQQLTRDPAARRRLQHAAARRARRYSLDRMTDRYLATYARLCAAADTSAAPRDLPAGEIAA